MQLHRILGLKGEKKRKLRKNIIEGVVTSKIPEKGEKWD